MRRIKVKWVKKSKLVLNGEEKVAIAQGDGRIDIDLDHPTHKSGKALLNTRIHELNHLFNWRWREKTVEEHATFLSDALWRLGYRPR